MATRKHREPVVLGKGPLRLNPEEVKAAAQRVRDDEAASNLTREELRAILVLEALAESWPASLTVYVSGSDSLAFSVIRTPELGSPAEDDLGFATVVSRIKIPSASSA